MSKADADRLLATSVAPLGAGWTVPREVRAAAAAVARLHRGGEPTLISRMAAEIVEARLAGGAAAVFEVEQAGLVTLRAAGARWRTNERDERAGPVLQTSGIARLVRSSVPVWGRLTGGDEPHPHRLGAAMLGQVPIVVAGTRWGMLVVAWRPAAPDRESDQWFLQQVATHLGLAIERALTERDLAGALAAQRAASTLEVQHARLDALATMASAVAHELSNALTTICGLTEWTLESLPAQAACRGDLELVGQAARDAGALVARLRAFAHAGRHDERDACRLDDVVEAALGAVRSRLDALSGEGRAIDVEHRRAGEAAVLGNAHDLEVATRELLQNAVDAMPEGGRLVVTTGLDGVEAFVAVGDEGPGVPVEVCVRPGQPRLAAGVRRLRGLGLSMCWRVAEAHGGRLTVEATPGRGSIATLSLPSTAAGHRPVAGPTPRPRTGRILVVDDDEDARVTLAGMLALLGWEVTVAASADDALTAMDRAPVDAVITDVAMPGRTGLELVQEMRRRGLTTPVAVLTGLGPSLGADGLGDVQVVRAKPVSLDGLARTVARLVARGAGPAAPTH